MSENTKFAAIVENPAVLPALLGSPKMVAWAEEIRAAAIRETGEYLAKLEGGDGAAFAPEIEARVVEIFLEEPASAYWIDTRGSWGADVLGGIESRLSRRAERPVKFAAETEVERRSLESLADFARNWKRGMIQCRPAYYPYLSGSRFRALCVAAADAGLVKYTPKGSLSYPF